MNRNNLSRNSAIKDAIEKIALHRLINNDTKTVRNSEKLTGYVAKIHTEGELAGTVDVQEYINWGVIAPEGVQPGYHEGVYLSAIQDSTSGMVIIPKMYSEVTIEADPVTLREYVVMFSHVELIRLDSHEEISIGVTEREEFDAADDEAPDVDQLPHTGAHAVTNYTKDAIVTDVVDQGGSNHTQHTIANDRFSVDVADGQSKQTITKDKIEAEHGDASLILGNDASEIHKGASSVVLKDGVVYVGSTSGVDDAVLGGELADIMMDMLDAISQIKTTTQLGPQPVLNMAQFISLKAKISAYKSSHSGFLTNKVQIQK